MDLVSKYTGEIWDIIQNTFGQYCIKNKVIKMSESIREEEIKIKGMHCKSCAEKIENRLSQLKGVEKARVSLVEEKAFVRFDRNKTNVDSIKKEIGYIGYETDLKIQTKKTSMKQGIVYGLVPHIGCIAFIIGSVLGVTVLTQFFRPLLLNPYFFDYLVALSLGFATLSSVLYLRRNGLLSTAGAKRKWKYLSTMYGSTIGINLLLFLVIFPLLANVSFATPTGDLLALSSNGNLASLKLQVDIPCSGHATLISGDLKAIDGVVGVQFGLPNIFEVSYDPSKTSEQQIIALDVFKTYKATVLSESSNQNQLNLVNANSAASINQIAVSDGTFATVTNGVQTVQFSVKGTNYYPNPVRVKIGIPVQLVADINNMPGCSKSIVIPEFGVRKSVSTSDNIIEFTPNKSGTFQFSCSMGMYHGQIIVENADGSVAAYTRSAPISSGTCGGPNGGCGCEG